MSGSMVISLTLIFESDAKIIKMLLGGRDKGNIFLQYN